MEENIEKISLLTAIVPIRPSLIDLKNVLGWLECQEASKIHFVLILDRPTVELERHCDEFFLTHENSALVSKLDIVKGDFSGPGRARNAGLPFVDSQYTAFWDSDDQPNIPIIVEYLLTHQHEEPKLVIGSFEINREGREKRLLHTTNLLQLARNPGLWRCLIPSKYLNSIEFPDILLGEDQVFIAKLIASCPPTVFSLDVFYTYVYGYSGQLSSNKDFSDLMKAENLVDRIDFSTTDIDGGIFVNNLSTKQLLTMLMRGNSRIRMVSISRIVKKLFKNPKRNSNSLRDMIFTPAEEKFNG